MACKELMEPSKGNRSPENPEQNGASEADISAHYARAVDYLYARINYERTADTAPYPFRLRRMNELMDRLDLHGIAGRAVPVVHVAGTKGKGSTSTMIAAMLTAGGFRTGLYTSPHLIRLEERFTVDGKMASKVEVIRLIEEIATEADRLAVSDVGAPTFFELTTAMALRHFQASECTAVVLEVGLGGKLDSTNACHPTVTAITSIGFDHQHILGNTLGEIATQKGGIIKPGIPIVTGVVQSDARSVIAEIAATKQARLFEIHSQFDCKMQESSPFLDWSTTFDLISRDEAIHNRLGWTVPLDGEHQARNASVACVVMDLLSASGICVSEDAQKRGLSNAKIEGRVERFRLHDNVDLILDTSHNIDSIAALCDCISRRSQGRPVTVVFGTSRDKEHRPMLALLSRSSDFLFLTRYHGNPRYRDTAELLRDLPQGETAVIEDDPSAAVQAAIGRVSGPHLIVVCGSFFLAAEVRPGIVDLALAYQSRG
jgi:dihydrofolate synthase/folylpolyglutamate synthase